MQRRLEPEYERLIVIDAAIGQEFDELHHNNFEKLCAKYNLHLASVSAIVIWEQFLRREQ